MTDGENKEGLGSEETPELPPEPESSPGEVVVTPVVPIDEPTQVVKSFYVDEDEAGATRLERPVQPWHPDREAEVVAAGVTASGAGAGYHERRPGLVAPLVTVALLSIMLGLGLGYLLFHDNSADSTKSSSTSATSSTTSSSVTSTTSLSSTTALPSGVSGATSTTSHAGSTTTVVSHTTTTLHHSSTTSTTAHVIDTTPLIEMSTTTKP